MKNGAADGDGNESTGMQMNRSRVLFFAAILVPLVGNTLPFYVWLPLLSITPGTVIRPMWEASVSMLAMMAALATGLPIGLSLISSGRRTGGWLCVLFSVTPLVVNWVVVNWICSARQLAWAD
jgi:hypothetical protein